MTGKAPKVIYMVHFKNPKNKPRCLNDIFTSMERAQKMADHINNSDGASHGAHVRAYSLTRLTDNGRDNKTEQ